MGSFFKLKNMVTVTLNIKAEHTKNYISSDKCPITLALQEAGYPDLRDTGLDITDYSKDEHPAVTNISNQDYRELSAKVSGMYGGNIPAEDFTATLSLNI